MKEAYTKQDDKFFWLTNLKTYTYAIIESVLTWAEINLHFWREVAIWMKSFKNTHSEPTISLLEVHPKETIKDVHNNLVLGIPIKKKKRISIMAQFT